MQFFTWNVRSAMLRRVVELVVSELELEVDSVNLLNIQEWKFMSCSHVNSCVNLLTGFSNWLFLTMTTTHKFLSLTIYLV